MEKINEGITYVFGESAAIDGEPSADWVADFFYYKNTPLFDDIFSKMRDAFWSVVQKLIVLFQ